MKHITAENLYDYAFLNEDTLVRPLRGICVCFHGYTDATTYGSSPEIARTLGAAGVAWVFPYYSVWAWMSRTSQVYNEQVLDAVYERLGADESTPLILSGGSMGGLTALNYAVYGKRRAVGCALNCPVTDFNRVFEDMPDVRRAILSAHVDADAPIDEVMRHYSPVQLVNRFPRVPYYFLFGECDAYFTDIHRPALTVRLDEAGVDYTLRIQPGMGHCTMEQHPDAMAAFVGFIVSLVNG